MYPILNTVSKRFFKINKGILQASGLLNSSKKTLVFILGCQQSGTNLMINIFRNDWRSKTYFERSQLTHDDKNASFRLKPLDEVEDLMSQVKASLIVLKPLVESQNATNLLNHFEGSKVVWMYRDFKSSALSNIRRFGVDVGIRNLHPIVSNDTENWRAQHVSDRVREIVLRYFSDEMDPNDALALFWFVRNSFFIEMNLATHPRAMLCKYEDLAIDACEMMQNIYQFIDRPYPGDRLVSEVFNPSVHKGQMDFHLSPDIEDLCADLLQKLDQIYAAKNPMRSVEQEKGEC